MCNIYTCGGFVEDKSITKIVLTGGPCAGKTTALSKIHDYFTSKGYDVLIIPETSTELIGGGVAPWTLNTVLDYQDVLIRLQLEKERQYEYASKILKSGNKKVLIVCDRGTLDCRAYINDDEFKELMRRNNTNIIELRDNYDAVFHLVSAAKGAEVFYTLANNTARTETVERAREVDDKTISAWIGHPHFRVIDNSTNFEDKINRLIGEISAVLGEPKPYEIERKYLIKMPSLDILNDSRYFNKSEIVQTYLKTNNDDEVRVRQSGVGGHYTYTKTTKKNISGAKRLEVEKRITRDEYLNLLLEVDTTKRQIRKTRYRFVYKNQYFEIDLYPFWKDKAIMEIELKDENQIIELPKFIKVLKEVTDEKEYKNYSLASKSY